MGTRRPRITRSQRKPQRRPTRRPRQPSASCGALSPQPLPRALICDDEPHICQLVSKVAAGLVQCETAGNGEEALAKLAAVSYDLLILDLKMPKVDGVGVLTALRARQHALRVIILTAYSDYEFAYEVYRTFHLHAYLGKPFKVDELRAAIQTAITQPSRVI